MLMTGALSSLPAKVFLDTSATHSHVSCAFVKRHNLSITETTGTVHCTGDAKTQPVCGSIHACLTLKGIKSELDLPGMDLPPGLDMCIGDA